MEKQKEAKIYTKVCRYCGKKIQSLSQQQCVYNFGLHEDACRRKITKEVNENDKETN